MRYILALLLVLISAAPAAAEPTAPVLRYGSLKDDVVNVRTGPGTRYPIAWIFKMRGYPIKVVGEFGMWLWIEDVEGERGWIYRTFFSGIRNVIVSPGANANLYAEPAAKTVRAWLEPGVIARLEECGNNMCRVHVAGHRGWVERKRLQMLSDKD